MIVGAVKNPQWWHSQSPHRAASVFFLLPSTGQDFVLNTSQKYGCPPAKRTERWAISSRDMLSSGSSLSQRTRERFPSWILLQLPGVLKRTGVLSLCPKILRTFERSYAQRSLTAFSPRQNLAAWWPHQTYQTCNIVFLPRIPRYFKRFFC